jgi:hypothetical protein
VILRSRRTTVPSRSKAPTSKGTPFFVALYPALNDNPSKTVKLGGFELLPLRRAKP